MIGLGYAVAIGLPLAVVLWCVFWPVPTDRPGHENQGGTNDTEPHRTPDSNPGNRRRDTSARTTEPRGRTNFTSPQSPNVHTMRTNATPHENGTTDIPETGAIRHEPHHPAPSHE